MCMKVYSTCIYLGTILCRYQLFAFKKVKCAQVQQEGINQKQVLSIVSMTLLYGKIYGFTLNLHSKVQCLLLVDWCKVDTSIYRYYIMQVKCAQVQQEGINQNQVLSIFSMMLTVRTKTRTQWQHLDWSVGLSPNRKVQLPAKSVWCSMHVPRRCILQ